MKNCTCRCGVWFVEQKPTENDIWKFQHFHDIKWTVFKRIDTLFQQKLPQFFNKISRMENQLVENCIQSCLRRFMKALEMIKIESICDGTIISNPLL